MLSRLFGSICSAILSEAVDLAGSVPRSKYMVGRMAGCWRKGADQPMKEDGMSMKQDRQRDGSTGNLRIKGARHGRAIRCERGSQAQGIELQVIITCCRNRGLLYPGPGVRCHDSHF